MSVQNVDFNFDKLKMYFGEDYQVTNKIKIFQPSIGNILDFGEKDFFSMLNIFIANTTVYRVPLWKSGIDWNKISDYELFCQMILQSNLTPKNTFLLFGDLDFSKFKVFCDKNSYAETESPKIFLCNKEQEIVIDEQIYTHISMYLRTMFNIFPKVEKAKGKTTKEWMIEEDIRNNEQKKVSDSRLLPMISFCLNHPGFKYKKKELKDMGIVEFNDSVQRLLIYESTSSLMKGMYSGFVDVSKINKDQFNFMREVNS